jgi:hypothetical protein
MAEQNDRMDPSRRFTQSSTHCGHGRRPAGRRAVTRVRRPRSTARTSDARSGLRRVLARDPADPPPLRPMRRRSSHLARDPGVEPCPDAGASSRPSAARAIGAYDGAAHRPLFSTTAADPWPSPRHLDARTRRRHPLRGGLRGAGPPLETPEPGFNQAADLAGQLHLPVLRALGRTRATASQTSLPAARRHQNVRDAFVATRAARAIPGEVVVLVDDVCTTGATLEACARVLKSVGAAEVRALTAARVVAQPR